MPCKDKYNTTRSTKKNKSKNTFNKYGKYTNKFVRKTEECEFKRKLAISHHSNKSRG